MKSRLEVKVKNTIHALDSLVLYIYFFLSSAVFFINLFMFVGFSAYDSLLSFSSRLFYLFYTLRLFAFSYSPMLILLHTKYFLWMPWFCLHPKKKKKKKWTSIFCYPMDSVYMCISSISNNNKNLTGTYQFILIVKEIRITKSAIQQDEVFNRIRSDCCTVVLYKISQFDDKQNNPLHYATFCLYFV